MTWLIWLLAGLAALLGIGYGAYRLISWPSLGSLAVTIFNAIAPAILKRKTPEEEALDREAYRRNEVRPTKQRPHPGEH